MSNRLFLKTSKLSLSIVFLSIMLIVSYIESIIPFSLGGIGVKIGLSNIVTILAIKTLSIRETIYINALRLIILGVLFGNLMRFIISVSGFILSFIVMAILLKKLKFSIIITSIYGAVFHNIGQIIAIFFFIKSINIISLIPIYIIFGVFTGTIIGITTNLLYKKLKVISIE